MLTVSKYLKLQKEQREFHSKYLSMFPVADPAYYHRQLYSNKFTKKEREQHLYELNLIRAGEMKVYFGAWVDTTHKLAKKTGYKNHLERFLAMNGVLKKDFDFFLKNIDNLIEAINKDYPAEKFNKEHKDWDILSTPHPENTLYVGSKFSDFESVCREVEKYDKRVGKYKDKIEIKYEDKAFYSGARMNHKRIVAEIVLDFNKDNTYDEIIPTLTLVHEIGHALDFLEGNDYKFIVESMSTYEKEYSANHFEHQFLKNVLDKKSQQGIKYNFLINILTALFEIDIHTNPSQDFDKAYANAINRCYPMAKQESNPLYVFKQGFARQPLYGILKTMNFTKFYLNEL